MDPKLQQEALRPLVRLGALLVPFRPLFVLSDDLYRAAEWAYDMRGQFADRPMLTVGDALQAVAAVGTSDAGG